MSEVVATPLPLLWEGAILDVDRLERLLSLRKLSATKLNELCEFPHDTITRWIRQRYDACFNLANIVGLDRVAMMAITLGVRTDDLLLRKHWDRVDFSDQARVDRIIATPPPRSMLTINRWLNTQHMPDEVSAILEEDCLRRAGYDDEEIRRRIDKDLAETQEWRSHRGDWPQRIFGPDITLREVTGKRPGALEFFAGLLEERKEIDAMSVVDGHRWCYFDEAVCRAVGVSDWLHVLVEDLTAVFVWSPHDLTYTFHPPDVLAVRQFLEQESAGYHRYAMPVESPEKPGVFRDPVSGKRVGRGIFRAAFTGARPILDQIHRDAGSTR